MSLHRISQQEKSELREIFDLMDDDHSESISTQELDQLMRTLRLPTGEAKLREIVKEVDIDGNGVIDFEEFVIVMSRKVKTPFKPEQLKHAFSVFRTTDDPPGLVRISALKNAITEYGSNPLDPGEASQLINQLDPDNIGTLDYDDYVNVMVSN